MKEINFIAAIVALLIASPMLAAKPAGCGNWDQNWMNCETTVDCTVVGDSCGSIRVTVNKKHVAEMTKFQTCIGKTQNCAPIAASEMAPKFKCEKYAFVFPGAKNPPPAPPARCFTLSSLIDMAINMDDRAKVEATLTEAGDVDFSLSHIHETPLTLAAMNSKTELVKLLISKGAKVNFQTKNGYSPLIFAAMSRAPDKKESVKTVQVLLQAGANKALKNMDGMTALDFAKKSGNQEIIKLLK